VDGITAEPATQELFEGKNGSVIINAASLDDVTVFDNNVDITTDLIRKEK